MINYERNKKQYRNAFTIVELIVVISVIGILAAITIVSYGSWKTNTTTNQLKSDLNGVASAMENARNFGTGYPATVPRTFIPSSGVTLAGGSLSSSTSYCVSATNGSQSYFISAQYPTPLVGTCPTLYLDAGIRTSYSGTGATWTDLSGNGNNGTLVNGTSYVSASGGALSFDGVDDRVETTAQTYGNNMTWTAWINCAQEASYFNMFMGNHLPYFGFLNGNSLIFSNYINNSQQSVVSTGAPLSLNTWYYVAFTTEYDGTNTIAKIYINGGFNQSGQFAGAQGNLGYNFTIGDGHIPTWYPFKGKVSSVGIHNITLSASQINQNFNALRGRYGL